MVKRPLVNRIWYRGLYLICRLLAVLIFRIRCDGRHHEPASGGVLVVSNHQSNLDPVLVGLCCRRRLNYVARDTLFGFAPFRWFINSLDAIPIDREGTGLGGLKETLRRLKRGEMVLLFPEGTRTRDGRIGRFKSGFCTLARRAKVPVLPIAMEGAYHCWPRQQRLPHRAVIHLRVGEPVWPREFDGLSDEQFVTRVHDRVTQCHAQLGRNGRL